MKLIPIDEHLAASPAIAGSEFLSGLCTAALALYPRGEPVPPWLCYFAEEDGAYVGTCAFKSPPVDGKVEIAYFTFPGHEGRGVATAMARRLLDLADRPEVSQVCAQTLKEENASVRILKKLGFRLAGTAMDADAGEVWEWHLR